jgi:hypothetical protein
LLLASRRDRAVQRLDRDGRVAGSWPLAEVHLLAVDPYGRAYAVQGAEIHRLEENGSTTKLVGLGEWEAPAALAADGAGRFWLLDRRGSRIARVDPGEATPRVQWEDRAGRLRGLAWDSIRLVSLDERTSGLVSLPPTGADLRPFGRLLFDRPQALSADPSGHLVVLEGRSAFHLRLLNAEGDEEARWPVEGLERPGGVSFARDGTIHLVGSDATWVVHP